jgi:tetratricopeptide (TPR) repeat protein
VIIERYGGTVEKFIGDAVMAVWGVPVAHEDDAERAVRAALDLVSGVSHLTDGEASLELRAGVLTGEAAVTVGAVGQAMVAGDLVNTASRLQSVAPPGTVLVGESTQRAASGAILFEPAGEQLLKGKAAPVPAWRAVQVVGLRGGAGRSGMREAPFVGRDEELRLVKDLFHATGREQKPRLLTVIGQAGIGKSRLAWEFEKYLDGISETGWWHVGRSPAYGEGISFWALAEMIRGRAGIAETDEPATAREHLHRCVGEFLPDADERRWVEPRLAGLLGLDELPPGQREELFAAWRTFFERLADQNTVILVFEELQWADQGLLDFIEHLLSWSRAHPIFVLAMTRPELLERRPGWGSGVRNATNLGLEPLTPAAMQQLLLGLVPGLPGAALQAVVDRSEGIPLYAVETVRMLLDRGQLRATDAGYAVEGQLDKLAVPETLRALIAARLDTMAAEDRATLMDAAVLGQSFTQAGLEVVTGETAAVLEPRLDRLVGHELIQRDNDPRSPERGQYQFVQALVREVATESLARADRRAKHLAAARFFESLGDDELAGVLASHYLEAHHATPAGPEADALAAQARIALRSAADRAAALHSYVGALRYYEDALQVTTDPAERAYLHERAAVMAAPLEFSVAFEHAREAAAAYRELGDVDAELRATAELARTHTNNGQAAETIKLLEPLAAQIGEDRPAGAFALAELARAYMLSSRRPEAVAMADRALAAVGQTRQGRVVVEALTTRGSALGQRPQETEALLRGAIAIADREGLVEPGLRARNNLASAIEYDVPWSEARAILVDGADAARRVGLAGWLAQLLDFRALSDTVAGDWDGAEAALREVETLHMDPVQTSLTQGVWAVLAAYRGDADAVVAHMAAVERTASDFDTAPQVSEIQNIRSEVLYASGDPAGAVAPALRSADLGPDFADAVNLAALAVAGLGDRAGMADLLARSAAFAPVRASRAVEAHIRAALAALDGRWDEALVAYQDALRIFREMEWGLDVARIGLEFDAFMGSVSEEARSAGADGEAFFVARGAESFPVRYRAAFKGTPAPAAEQPRSAATSRAAVAVGEDPP